MEGRGAKASGVKRTANDTAASSDVSSCHLTTPDSCSLLSRQYATSYRDSFEGDDLFLVPFGGGVHEEVLVDSATASSSRARSGPTRRRARPHEKITMDKQARNL